MMILFGLVVFVVYWVVSAEWDLPNPLLSDRDRDIHRRHRRMRMDPEGDARRAAVAYVGGLSDTRANRDAIARLQENTPDEPQPKEVA